MLFRSLVSSTDLSYLIAFLGFAVLILLHEFGHFAAAKAVGMRVERFSLFFPPHIWKRTRGETEYAIGVIPLGGYVKITGMNPREELADDVADRAYFRMPVWKRVVVIAAGPAMNVLIAFFLIFGLFLHFGVSKPGARVTQIERGSVAERVLKPGDVLLSVDGVRGSNEKLRKQLGTHRCAGTPVEGCQAASAATLVVRRGASTVTLHARPRYDARKGSKVMRLGFTFGGTTTPVGAGGAASLTVSEMWDVTTLSINRLVRLVFDKQARKDVSGVAS